MKVARSSLPSFLPTVRSFVRPPSASVLVAFGDELLHEPVGCIRRERKPRGRRRRRRRRRRSGLLGSVGMLQKPYPANPYLQATLKLRRVNHVQKYKSSESIAHLAPLSGRDGREQREEKWRESHRCSPRWRRLRTLALARWIPPLPQRRRRRRAPLCAPSPP